MVTFYWNLLQILKLSKGKKKKNIKELEDLEPTNYLKKKKKNYDYTAERYKKKIPPKE